MKHPYEIHPNIDFKVQQFYTDPILCPDEPTVQDMELPPYNCSCEFIVDVEYV
jgi:hypothetical protein